MKNLPLRERQHQRTRSAYGLKKKVPFPYPPWVVNGSRAPEFIAKELRAARYYAALTYEGRLAAMPRWSYCEY